MRLVKKECKTALITSAWNKFKTVIFIVLWLAKHDKNLKYCKYAEKC